MSASGFYAWQARPAVSVRGRQDERLRHQLRLALGRRFTVAAPNRVWAADSTGIPTHEGWLYLAVLLDLWSRRVVGWALRPTLDTDLVCAALHLVVARRTWRRGLRIIRIAAGNTRAIGTRPSCAAMDFAAA